MAKLLNLLPPGKKKALRQGLVLAFAMSMTLIVFLVFLTIAATIISVRVVLANNYAALKAPVTGEDDFSSSANSIKLINGYINRINGYVKRSTGWPERLIAISGLVPPGVVIQEMTFSGGTLIIHGSAANREDMLTFIDRLEKQPYISKLDSPLSNLLQKKDVQFELSMKYALDTATK